MRAGIGFDAHRFGDAVRLVLGGVPIDHPLGLAGHSDGDVVSHAVVDAVLGAARAGDIGMHFPPSEERWRGVASGVFLEHASRLAGEAGYAIVSVDVTVICEEPPLAPYREKIEASLAASLGVDESSVSMKATTSDGMGFTGRGEGIAAIAVALLASIGPSEGR